MLKSIEEAGRTCYKSENKLSETQDIRSSTPADAGAYKAAAEIPERGYTRYI